MSNGLRENGSKHVVLPHTCVKGIDKVPDLLFGGDVDDSKIEGAHINPLAGC